MPRRFFINVALVRVLYAHTLVAAPRLALGQLAPLASLVGDPRLGMAGAFLSLRRVLPNRYPLEQDVESYIANEQRLGRMLDYAVIVPRLQRLYESSAEELDEPRLLGVVRDGGPIYAWPYEKGNVWRVRHMPFAARGARTRHEGSLTPRRRRGPETGQLLAEFEDRQRFCEAAVCACRLREACEQLTCLARVDDPGRRNGKGLPAADDVAASVAQVPKPMGPLAVEESDHQRPVPSERKERRPVLAVRASTAVKDDRPRRHEPRV